MKWIYLSIAIVSEVIATSTLKESEGFTKLVPSIITFIGYSFTFYFLSLTLKEIPIGLTYAIWSGIGICLLSIIGYFRYNQILDFGSIIGISLIGLGVIVINVFSKNLH
ncbi:MAG: QacE family quaternary ammonium compound efflux SMR transporter [Candidatus Marinimicrobia bacterium]|nr:QacE family quaternary ammonium compound efflux SMR transporter [Candidatus Neomarinimicrobiota bacterium]|tara:strand:+ start:146 stop:472 length:327 start_codon:yes stop_codon:yes gene_type:complete